MVFYIEGNDIINHHGSGLTSTIPGLYKSEQAIRRSYIEATGNVIINHHGSGVNPTIPGPYKSSQGIKWSCVGDHNIIMDEIKSHGQHVSNKQIFGCQSHLQLQSYI